MDDYQCALAKSEKAALTLPIADCQLPIESIRQTEHEIGNWQSAMGSIGNDFSR
jgi:hypothetical protein